MSQQKFGPFLRQYLKQSLEVFRHPRLLLPSFILTVVWIVLGIVQIKVQDSLPVKVLNFLTYAQGGLYGGVIGAIGGILGKVFVAACVNALLVPLFQGKKPLSGLGGGFKELFGTISFQSRAAVAPLLKGLGAALMIYALFNLTESFQNSLVGIVGAVALANAAGRKGGFLWGLAFSYANSVSGGRTPKYQSVLRALSGMTLGFALGFGLNAAGIRWAGAAGLPILILGWILGAGTRKEAAATAALILLFLIPQPRLRAQDDENPFLALMPKTFGAEREALQLENGSGSWVLKKVETEVKSSGSGPALFWTGTISNLKISDETDISFDYVWTENATGKSESGHGSTTITKVKGAFAPGAKLVVGLTGSTSGRAGDVIGYGHAVSLSDNVYGPGDEVSCQSQITLFFPSPDDVPGDRYEFTFTFHLCGAYISNRYIFEWDTGRISLTLQDLSDLTWWLQGGEGEHAPLEWTVLIAIFTGFTGAIGGGLGGGLGGAAGAGGAAGGPVPPPGPEPPGPPAPPEQQAPPPEEVDDYDYEAERAQRAREQEEINRRYASDHQRDWEKFSTTSDEERITRETEEAMRAEEERQRYLKMFEEEEQRQQNVLLYAEKYGVPTTDADGNPREFWEIEHDTRRASMWEKNKGIYKDSLDIQKIAAEVELRCSEKIAELELTQELSEGTVNVVAEFVPAVKKVKDARDLIKETAVGGMEAYVNGRSVTKGLVTGSVRGLASVAQNRSGDMADAQGLKGATKFFTTGTVNVLSEVVKAQYESIEREDSWEETFENVQQAIVKKTGEHLLNSGLGALGMNDKSANLTTEILMRGHDKLKFGEGDNARTLSETVTDRINNAKNEALANVMYQTGLY